MSDVAVVRRWTAAGRSGARLYMWCPGCEDLHAVVVEGEPLWQWDGNLDAPTISPSIKVEGVQWAPEFTFHRPRHAIEVGGHTVCHSYVTRGQWIFLGDCTHDLRGQTVPMVPIPAGLWEEEHQ